MAVLVSSSDRTVDVFEKVFAGFQAAWPDCPYRRYVGVSTRAPRRAHGFMPLVAGFDRGWAAELLEQLAQLPGDVDYVVLLLDDFLLQGRVDTNLVDQVASLAVAGGLPYLRLRPTERSLWVATLRSLAGAAADLTAVRLKRDEPYFSALQAAIWSRSHLQHCLRDSGSIWDFEHMIPTADHFAVNRRVLFYRHVVQKGQWRGYAPRYFRRETLEFEPGDRPLRGADDDRLFQLERFKFALLGYAGPRLKALLRGKRS